MPAPGTDLIHAGNQHTLLSANGARPAEYREMTWDRDLLVPMRDGVHPCVDIYRPRAAGGFPALLTIAPHNKDLQNPWVSGPRAASASQKTVARRCGTTSISSSGSQRSRGALARSAWWACRPLRWRRGHRAVAAPVASAVAARWRTACFITSAIRRTGCCQSLRKRANDRRVLVRRVPVATAPQPALKIISAA